MALRKAQPVVWKPTGVSDAATGGNVFAGAMSSLKNLVPDPSTKNLFVPRPASLLQTDFSGSGFTSPGVISVMRVIGDIIYGMIATSNPGSRDRPFIYNITTDTFTSISGVTISNTPVTQSSTGPWTPPTIAIVGTRMVVTHPGFSGANKVGFLDLTTNTWSAGDTSPNLLPDKPVAVSEFAGRAYYAVNNRMYFTDILDATTVDESTDFLTIGDDSPVVGLGKIPLDSITSGSIETLMVFKDKTIFQITGDIALDTLLNSEVSSGVGTLSPLSIASTTKGLMFISQHGLRTIDANGDVSPVIGADGSGVSVPFINTVEPSRIAGSFNVNTYRVNTQNSFIPTLPFQDWWYNTDLGIWTGPHSFPARIIQPHDGSFMIAPQSVDGQIWRSDIVPVESSSYVENGAQLEFLYRTVLLPHAPTMNESAVIETAVGIQFSKVGGTLNFFAENEDEVLLNLVSKTIDVTASIWGTTSWGTSQWGGNVTKYQGIHVPWTEPLVFGQAFFGVSGRAVNGFKIGPWENRYQFLGYMDQR